MKTQNDPEPDTRLSRYVRWPLAVLLVAHGAIHVLGFLWAFNLAQIEEIGSPTLLFAGAELGDPGTVAFGLLWLVAMVAFIAAGIGVARGTAWSIPVTGIAAGISLVPTIVWWNDAWIGAVLSGFILVVTVMSLTGGRATRSPGQGPHAPRTEPPDDQRTESA